MPVYGAMNRRTVSIGGDCRSSVALSSASSALLKSGSGEGSSGIGVVALDVLNVGMPLASSVLKCTVPPVTKSTRPSPLTSLK